MSWLLLLLPLAMASEPEFGPTPPPAPEVVDVEPSLEELLAAAQTRQPGEHLLQAPAAQQVSAPAMPEVGTWLPWLLALAGAGATTLFLRRKLGTAGGPRFADTPAMTVVARQSLGQQGTLLLVQAQAGDGRTRRLLLSAGATGGVPTLVADLGAEALPDVPYAEPPPLPLPQAEPQRRAAPQRAFTLPEPELTPRQGRSLVDELLAERRGGYARRSA